MKTAVKKLIDRIIESKEITPDIFVILTPLLSKAEDEEKQQIIEAHYHGSEEPYSLSTGANKYYNETFS